MSPPHHCSPREKVGHPAPNSGSSFPHTVVPKEEEPLRSKLGVLGGAGTAHLIQARRKRLVAQARAGNAFSLRGRMNTFSSQVFSLTCCFGTAKHQDELKGMCLE